MTRVEDVTVALLRETAIWTRALPALHRAYQGRCAYLARFIEWVEGPSVDHFVALRNDRALHLAFEWSNFRLAHAFINGCKSDLPNVLDPFEVGEGWFALDLATGRTVVGPEAPPEQIEAIRHTIARLKLDGNEVARTRRRAAERYLAPPPGQPALPLWCLQLDEPFVAQELRRQGRLNPGDEWTEDP